METASSLEVSWVWTTLVCITTLELISVKTKQGFFTPSPSLSLGIFDRSSQLPTGGVLEQADGTAWMAFYCGTLLNMAWELAAHDPEYEDMASKFFEHFVMIVDAINKLGKGEGLWSEKDGFYYDHLR